MSRVARTRASRPGSGLFAGRVLGLLVAALVTAAVTTTPAAGISDCSNTSVGLTPINDLRTGTYRGAKGGLYPGGTNRRPPAHGVSGQLLADSIVPLNSAGLPDPNGRYVLISIGMSNTTREFQSFKALADEDPDKDPRLLIVDGAQGGVSAREWSNTSDPAWTEVDRRLRAAGVTPQQVTVAWVKVADPRPISGWPDYARTLRSEMAAIARHLHARYANIALAYYSSRIYAGYASTSLNPEPYAYESGFSVKWLVGRQIAGRESLNFDPEEGAVVAPWLSWGAYLWADGLDPRRDGLIWECANFEEDGTHPSESGARKVANRLLAFFQRDATARLWFSPSTPTERSVSLRLRRHLVARGRVTVVDGFIGCRQGVPVTIQRKTADGWVDVGGAIAGERGFYRDRIADRPGRYRAKAARLFTGSEDDQLCLADASPVRRHSH
jgi:hypothetical protein